MTAKEVYEKFLKKDYDINKISFEILLEEKDIKDFFNAEAVNMWEYERVEKELIENLKPDGNIEGVSTIFSYNSSMRKYLTKKQEEELKGKIKKYLKEQTWEIITKEE